MRHSAFLGRASSIALLALFAVAGAGCKTSPFTGATSGFLASSEGAGEPRSEEAWRREAQTVGERYRRNPKDATVAMRYAEALRHSGQREQAAAVLQQASISNPNNRPLLGAYGRALADSGKLNEALDMLSRAHTPDQPDWRVLSAQGAVLDQMGRHKEAREQYAAALKITPEDPGVLSNLGLSYLLSKDLKQSESTLRRAVARGKVDGRVRQNLALVVGLQGRFKEAEEIARSDLPPPEAAENIAYLKQMLAQHERPKAKSRNTTRTAAVPAED